MGHQTKQEGMAVGNGPGEGREDDRGGREMREGRSCESKEYTICPVKVYAPSPYKYVQLMLFVSNKQT